MLGAEPSTLLLAAMSAHAAVGLLQQLPALKAQLSDNSTGMETGIGKTQAKPPPPTPLLISFGFNLKRDCGSVCSSEMLSCVTLKQHENPLDCTWDFTDSHMATEGKEQVSLPWEKSYFL